MHAWVALLLFGLLNIIRCLVIHAHRHARDQVLGFLIIEQRTAAPSLLDLHEHSQSRTYYSISDLDVWWLFTCKNARYITVKSRFLDMDVPKEIYDESTLSKRLLPPSIGFLPCQLTQAIQAYLDPSTCGCGQPLQA